MNKRKIEKVLIDIGLSCSSTGFDYISEALIEIDKVGVKAKMSEICRTIAKKARYFCTCRTACDSIQPGSCEKKPIRSHQKIYWKSIYGSEGQTDAHVENFEMEGRG